MRPTYWFHVGMPKCASTAIQYGLRNSFLPEESRSWDHKKLGSRYGEPNTIDKYFNNDWENLRKGELFEPLAIKKGQFRLISCEDLCGLPPPPSDLGDWSGLAIVRNPKDWLVSAAVQSFVTGPTIGKHVYTLGDSILSGKVVNNEQFLMEALSRKAFEYKKRISQLLMWKANSELFEIVPYSKGMSVSTTLQKSLSKIGLKQEIEEIPILRSGQSGLTLQLALSIYAVALREFSLSVENAFHLAKLSMIVEDQELSGRLQVSTPSFRNDYESLLNEAIQTYELLDVDHQFCQQEDSPSNFPLDLVDEDHLLQLSRLIVRARIRRGFTPKGFDERSYVNMNSDLLAAAPLGDDFENWARTHWECNGLFEGRPAPIIKG